MKHLGELNDLTWAWTTAQLIELTAIGVRARKASLAAPSLDEKVALQKVAIQAERGLRAIATIFGEETKLAEGTRD